MFYSQFILAKKGPLGTIWIAAHLERKLRKNQVADTDIGVSVDSILFPDAPIALRLSSHLLLGVVRIYSRKVGYLFDDCSEALLKVKQAFRSTAVDLPPEESKAPYHSITLPETFELDDFELPDNEIFQGDYVDHHISARDQITLQDNMEGVVYSTSRFGLDERFGDGDTSGLDLEEELFMDKVAAAGDASASAGPRASVEPMTPLKQDEHHEGMAANSESMIDGVDGDADLMDHDHDHAPSTPGLAEEPNMSNVQETSACEEHLGQEDRNLMENATKGNIESLSFEKNTNNGSELVENQAMTGSSDVDTVHYVAPDENGYHLGKQDGQLPPSGIAIDPVEPALQLEPDGELPPSGIAIDPVEPALQLEPDGELPPSGIAIDPVEPALQLEPDGELPRSGVAIDPVDTALASETSSASVHEVNAKSSSTVQYADEIVQKNEWNFQCMDKVDGFHAEPLLPNGIGSTNVGHDVSTVSAICQPVPQDTSASNQRSPNALSNNVATPGNLEVGNSQDITYLETPKVSLTNERSPEVVSNKVATPWNLGIGETQDVTCLESPTTGDCLKQSVFSQGATSPRVHFLNQCNFSEFDASKSRFDIDINQEQPTKFSGFHQPETFREEALHALGESEQTSINNPVEEPVSCKNFPKDTEKPNDQVVLEDRQMENMSGSVVSSFPAPEKFQSMSRGFVDLSQSNFQEATPGGSAVSGFPAPEKFQSMSGGFVDLSHSNFREATPGGSAGSSFPAPEKFQSMSGGFVDLSQSNFREATPGGSAVSAFPTPEKFQSMSGGFVDLSQSNFREATPGGSAVSGFPAPEKFQSVSGGFIDLSQSNFREATPGGSAVSAFPAPEKFQSVSRGFVDLSQSNFREATPGGSAGFPAPEKFQSMSGGFADLSPSNFREATPGGSAVSAFPARQKFLSMSGGFVDLSQSTFREATQGGSAVSAFPAPEKFQSMSGGFVGVSQSNFREATPGGSAVSAFPAPEKFLSMSGGSAFPAPEKFLSTSGGLVNLSQSTATPGYLGINEADAGSKFIPGRKRSHTESTLTEQSFNSAESSRMVRSKMTAEYIPNDDDLLSSILVGRNSSALKLKPTPPPSDITSGKRPRAAARMSSSKKRVLMDAVMVLHGDMIRQQLIDVEDIRRMRKKAPCTHAETSAIQRQVLENHIFGEAVITGLSAKLVSLHKQTFDLRRVKVSFSEVSCSQSRTVVRPELKSTYATVPTGAVVRPELKSNYAEISIPNLNEQRAVNFKEAHVESESGVGGSRELFVGRDDNMKLGAVDATVPTDNREIDNHDLHLSNDASQLRAVTVSDTSAADGFHFQPSENLDEQRAVIFNEPHVERESGVGGSHEFLVGRDDSMKLGAADDTVPTDNREVDNHDLHLSNDASQRSAVTVSDMSVADGFHLQPSENLDEQHAMIFNERHVERESRVGGSHEVLVGRDDSMKLGAVDANVPTENRELDNHDLHLSNDASQLRAVTVSDMAVADDFHLQSSENAEEIPQSTYLPGAEVAAYPSDIAAAAEATDITSAGPNNGGLGGDADVGLPLTDSFNDSRREDAFNLPEVSGGSPNHTQVDKGLENLNYKNPTPNYEPSAQVDKAMENLNDENPAPNYEPSAQVDKAMENLNSENVVGGSYWPENNYHSSETETEAEAAQDDAAVEAAQDNAAVEAAVTNNVGEDDRQSLADKGVGAEQPNTIGASYEEMNMQMLDHSTGTGQYPFQQEDFSYNMMGEHVSHANLSDHDDLDSGAENDTGFLNFDDDDDEVEAADDDYVPEADATQIPENSGWSSRTRAVSKYLQTLFVKDAERGRKSLSMDSLLVGKTRKEASRLFFESLVLKTRDYIHVEQVTPFDDITIMPRTRLMKSDF